MRCIHELKKRGTTVLIVTHKTNLLAMSDKALMLVDGKVEKFGSTKEMFAQSANEPATAPSGQAPQSEADKARDVVSFSTAETKRT